MVCLIRDYVCLFTWFTVSILFLSSYKNVDVFLNDHSCYNGYVVF